MIAPHPKKKKLQTFLSTVKDWFFKLPFQAKAFGAVVLALFFIALQRKAIKIGHAAALPAAALKF